MRKINLMAHRSCPSDKVRETGAGAGAGAVGIVNIGSL